MVLKETITHNLYTISGYSNSSIVKIFLGITSLNIFFWILSASSPKLVQDTKLENRWCQEKLNFTYFRELDYITFTKRIKENYLCFLCIQNVPLALPFGVAMILGGPVTIPYEQSQNMSAITSIVGSGIKNNEECLSEGLQLTSVKKFPLIDNQKKMKNDNLTLIYDQKEQNLIWECSIHTNTQFWLCNSKQLIFQSNEFLENIKIYQQLLSSELVSGDLAVEYVLLQYNDQYFIYNEIQFMIWIGLELLYFILVVAFKSDTNINDLYVLVPTYRNYKQIMLAVFLNNDCLFPIQVFHDTENLRLVHMICHSAAMSYLFYFIFTGVRNIIAQQISRSLVSKVMDLFLIALFFSTLINIQIKMEKNLADRIIHDVYTQGLFSQIELDLSLVQVGITLLGVNFFAKLIYAGYLQSQQNESLTQSSKEVQFNRSCRLFILYSLLFGTSILSRLIYQYMFVLQIELVYFDQLQVVLINFFFFLLWLFFDQLGQEVIVQHIYNQFQMIKMDSFSIRPIPVQDLNESDKMSGSINREIQNSEGSQRKLNQNAASRFVNKEFYI